MNKSVTLADESATLALGAELAQLCRAHAVVGISLFLTGTLGAGKTTFCRGFLQALGHSGAVKSPTYTLVEPYELDGLQVFHFDLYRLGHPEELEYMGIRDYFKEGSLCLVEWPEKGQGILAAPDLCVQFEVSGTGRTVTMRSESERGLRIVEQCGS